jgi:hypothetical protein
MKTRKRENGCRLEEEERLDKALLEIGVLFF